MESESSTWGTARAPVPESCLPLMVVRLGYENGRMRGHTDGIMGDAAGGIMNDSEAGNAKRVNKIDRRISRIGGLDDHLAQFGAIARKQGGKAEFDHPEEVRQALEQLDFRFGQRRAVVCN